MRRRQCALLLVLLGLAADAPLQADSPSARTLIHDCAQRAKASLRGIEALRAACPAIGTAIEDLGLVAVLPADWKARVSPRAMADWSALANRYAEPALSPLPPPSSLRTIAMQLRPPPMPATWWERFKTWVASWPSAAPGRWPDWLRFLPSWRPGASLLYGLMCLAMIAAAAVVVIELRAAGVFGAGQRRTRPPRRSVTALPATAEEPIGPADVDGAPEHLRPVVLLRLLVAALTRSHRLGHDRDLTCRELIKAAHLDTTEQLETFATVALLAEQVLYGDPRHAPLPLNDAVMGNARGLYGQLLAAPAEEPVR